MFAGIVGALFAIGEGRFLDIIRSHGLFAFTTLFFFGTVFGLASAWLNIPQPDCPLVQAVTRPTLLQLLRQTIRNKPFVTLAVVHTVIAWGGIAGPFNAAYSLRDIGLSYFALGLLNSVSTVAILLTSPGWGRLVDRFGCRPILITGLLIMAPCAFLWMAIPPHAVRRAYYLIPWMNGFAGIGAAAIGISLSTMMYKLSNPAGRSVQFAAYSTFVGLISAPMPLLGGWLVSKLAASGYAIDLRLTFYIWSAFMFLAAALATRLKEAGSATVPAFVFSYFPQRMAGFLGVNIPPMTAPFSIWGRFQARPKSKNDNAPPAP